MHVHGLKDGSPHVHAAASCRRPAKTGQLATARSRVRPYAHDRARNLWGRYGGSVAWNLGPRHVRARFITSPACRREGAPAQLVLYFLFNSCGLIYCMKGTATNENGESAAAGCFRPLNAGDSPDACCLLSHTLSLFHVGISPALRPL